MEPTRTLNDWIIFIISIVSLGMVALNIAMVIHFFKMSGNLEAIKTILEKEFNLSYSTKIISTLKPEPVYNAAKVNPVPATAETNIQTYESTCYNCNQVAILEEADKKIGRYKCPYCEKSNRII